MIALVVLVTVGFVALPFFGIYGLYEILESFGLVKIDFYASALDNVKYFGFLLLIMYLITVVLDIASKAIFLLKRKKFTKRTMILNYLIQVLLSTYLLKIIINANFTRIDLSLMAIFITYLIIYLIYYVLLDDEDYL